MNAWGGEAHRAVAIERDSGGEGRTEVAKTLAIGRSGLGDGDWRARHESERLGVVSVQELGNADVRFPDDASDAGERQLQFVGRGSDGKKDAGLDSARVHRF